MAITGQHLAISNICVTLTFGTFRERFTVICIQLFEYALGKHNERNGEVTTFYECINEAKEDNRNMGVTNIDEFIQYKAVVSVETVH